MGHATLTYIYEENVGSEKGLAVAANMTHAVDAFLVRELTRRCSYNQDALFNVSEILVMNMGLSKASPYVHHMEKCANDHGFMSLRGVEFINDKSVLEFSLDYRKELYALIQEVLSKPRFDVICIHDEFKCHPKYMNYLRECYVGILAELADSTVGQQIIREVRNDPSYVLEKLSTTLGDQIMKSEYFLS